MEPVKATVLDDDKFRLLAIPFGGPIPHPAFPRGVDLDGETFTERTDIKASWFPTRPVDWHHGGDVTLGRTVIGKAANLTMDEDGWWVDVWLNHGERRLDLIKRLAEQAQSTGKATIFGSSEPVKGFVGYGPFMSGGKALTDAGLRQGHPLRRGEAREIKVWAFGRETLSTSPQNTLSTIRPLKATFDDLLAIGSKPSAAFWQDVLADRMTDLGDDLRATSRGELEAKAGRVLSASNERDLRAALAAFEEAAAKLAAVMGRQPDYGTG